MRLHVARAILTGRCRDDLEITARGLLRRRPAPVLEMTTNYACYCTVVMRRVNALELRQSLGKVLGLLQRSGQPVVIEKRGREVAVLISLRDFRERFSEK